jgi:hypothetical protein
MHGIRSASVAALAVAVTMTTTAAQTSQTSTPATGSTSANQAQAGTMTLTGCVERADQVAPAPVGAAAATTADSQTFVLIKAEAPVASASSGTAGATGTSGTSAPAGTMYRLDGDVSKISPHVGHRVEIMGSFEQPVGTTIVGATPDPNNVGAAANPLAATVAPRLKVDSIKMIADLCPR